MKIEYTHYAKFQTIPCYFNENTGEITGRNWFYSKVLDFMIFIELLFPTDCRGFPIEILEPLEKDNRIH